MNVVKQQNVSALALANYLIDYFKERQDDSLNRFKLNRLVYVISSIYPYIANRKDLSNPKRKDILNSSLEEAVEAWKIGPMIPSIHYLTNRLGGNVVKDHILIFDEYSETFVDYSLAISDDLAFEETIRLMEKHFFSLSSKKLGEILRAPMSPWGAYYNKHFLSKGLYGGCISRTLSYLYFKEMYDFLVKKI